MLAIARALMQKPRLLVLDEPTLGLAPSIVEQVQGIIAGIHASGVTILLIEQNVRTALELADYAYVVEGGRVAWSGTTEALRTNQQLSELYLGGAIAPSSDLADQVATVAR
jgi:branched-chain amino acid transport system ATP-binding protein